MAFRLFVGGILVAACLIEAIPAGEPVKILNLEKLNTAADEEDPATMPNGLSLLFARKGKTGYEIFKSDRTSATTTFGPGKMLLSSPGADCRAPFFHGQKLYYTTNEIVDEKLANLKNFDIKWRIDTQAPLFVPGDVPTKDDESYPFVTPAGKEFYFSRKTEDGWKLFVALGPVPGPIGNAKAVGFPADFHRAALIPSGLLMYLQGPVEGGRTGIFRSKRAKIGGAWSEPEAVDAINSPEGKRGDMQPAISADGSRLYFVSDRPGGKGGLDLWVAPTASLK